MNKYDHARTIFSLQGFRVFSVLLSFVITLFIILTAINLFTNEWDYPPFLLIILPFGYGIAFLVWKFSTSALKKTREELKQQLLEEENIKPGSAKKGRIFVLLIQIAIALFIFTILGNFISSQARRQGQEKIPAAHATANTQQKTNS